MKKKNISPDSLLFELSLQVERLESHESKYSCSLSICVHKMSLYVSISAIFSLNAAHKKQ